MRARRPPRRRPPRRQGVQAGALRVASRLFGRGLLLQRVRHGVDVRSEAQSVGIALESFTLCARAQRSLSACGTTRRRRATCGVFMRRSGATGRGRPSIWRLPAAPGSLAPTADAMNSVQTASLRTCSSMLGTRLHEHAGDASTQSNQAYPNYRYARARVVDRTSPYCWFLSCMCSCHHWQLVGAAHYQNLKTPIL